MWGDFADAVGINTGGHNTYVFRPSNGTDYVYDLHHGEDIIELRRLLQWDQLRLGILLGLEH